MKQQTSKLSQQFFTLMTPPPRPAPPPPPPPPPSPSYKVGGWGGAYYDNVLMFLAWHSKSEIKQHKVIWPFTLAIRQSNVICNEAVVRSFPADKTNFSNSRMNLILSGKLFLFLKNCGKYFTKKMYTL